MAAFVNGQNTQVDSGATSSASIGKPPSVSTGNILVLWFYAENWDPGTFTPPTGFTQQAYAQGSPDGYLNTIVVFTKTATGSEPSSYTLNWANSSPASAYNLNFAIGNYSGPATVLTGYAAITAGGVANTWPSSTAVQGGLQCLLSTPYLVSAGSWSPLSQDLEPDASTGYFSTTFTSGSVPSRTSTGGSPFGSTNGFAGLLLGAPTAPATPTLIFPASGGLADAASIIPFQMQYNSTDGANQNGYTLGIKQGTNAIKYWNATAGTLTSTTPVWNSITGGGIAPGGTLTVNLPAAVLTNGLAYTWTSASQESLANLQGAAATASSFTTQVAPTVTITAPTNGSTITTTNQPTVTWTETLHSGSVQTGWRVVIESGSYGSVPGSGTSVVDTGVVPTAALTSGALGPLPNSTTYRLFLQITQTGGQNSLWGFVTVTISVTPPNTPTLTAAAGTDPMTGMPRVVLTAQGSDTGPKWTYLNTAAEFEVSLDGGLTWDDVIGASQVAPDSTDKAVAYAYVGPFGYPAEFRVRMVGSPGPTAITGLFSTVATIRIYSDITWILDPTNPATAIGLELAQRDDDSYGITQDVTYTIGAEFATIEQDVWQGRTGGSTWLCQDLADRAALLALIQSGVVLQQLDPNEYADPGDTIFFLPTGPIAVKRTGQQWVPQRTLAISWAEQAAP